MWGFTILELTGVKENEYWKDPIPISVEAYRQLALDGLVDVNVPSERGGYTLVTSRDMDERARYTDAESVVAEIEQLPSPEDVLATCDTEALYQTKLAEMRRMQELCGEMVWCPARWEVIPNFEWFRVYGYENYLMALGLYAESICRLYRHAAAVAECQARVVARMKWVLPTTINLPRTGVV